MSPEVKDLLRRIAELGNSVPREDDCWGYKDPPPKPFIKIKQRGKNENS